MNTKLLTIIFVLALIPMHCRASNFDSSIPSLSVARPSFTAQPEDQVAEPGASVQMRCAGEANPPPMLYWYKEGHRQLMFAPRGSTTSPIPPLQPKTPSAPEWPQSPLPLVSDNRHIVSDTSPAINKIFSMPLSADQPNPSGSFGNSFFGNRIYVDNHGTLHITNATASDTGYYACALVSSVGSVLTKAKITIKQHNSDFLDQIGIRESLHSRSGGSLSSALSKIDLLPPPVIKLGSINQTLPTNTSTVLVCDVVSQVPYKIQWLFESQPLTEEPGRVVVQDTGALSINYLRPSDSGIYTCVVTAANDQVMPIASPFEPLDSSMLTSAPPIQQSTSHSAWLKVMNPMNPNVKFTKMDPYALPSSPGPAYLVSTNGNDAITIAWAPPVDSGTLPVKEYIVEHYDTSQEHARWKVIYRIKGKESLLVDGLSSEGSHFFVIRAVNSRGTGKSQHAENHDHMYFALRKLINPDLYKLTGPSSPIAGPFRTNAFQARYDAELKRHGLSDPSRFTNDGMSFNSFKQDLRDVARERLMKISTNLISLTPISSSSVRLQWTIQLRNSTEAYFDTMTGSSLGSDVDEVLEGFSIRYRAVGVGSGAPTESLPGPLPLVTSYVEEEHDTEKRPKRELSNLIDYSQEFNEIRITDHSIEHYTVNELKPFTLYQFFVVPYYKDIDGVPSNILSVQTTEDRPSVAPPYLTIRSLNSTAVRLLWLHIPPHYSNGVLRGYLIQVNQTASESTNRPTTPETTRYLSLADLNIATLTSYSPDARILPATSSPQYVVMYELSNLTHKSFYSVQVAAMTNVGAGPWSDTQNFIMDPEILDKMKATGDSGFDDLIAKSVIPFSPQSYGNLVSGLRVSSLYLVLAIVFGLAIVISVVGYVLYQRNNQRVLTWRKTISEHFTNKFYMPSTADHHCGTNSIQQNVYDHQAHLIYAAATQIPAQSFPQKNMWQKNGRINSSETGSLSSSSHGGGGVGAGGLIPISSDPASTNRHIVGEQVFLMKNNKDMASRFSRGANGQMSAMQPQCLDTTCTLGQQPQISGHGDYYSVINNMAEYEEVDSHQAMRAKGQGAPSGSDLHQTASSNSDTSCPSSVTRLLPNQNYNRELLTRTYNENQRLEMIVQQQQQGNFIYHGKPQFVTMSHNQQQQHQQQQHHIHQHQNSGGIGAPRLLPLSPYATTNLMSRIPQQQIFINPVHQASPK